MQVLKFETKDPRSNLKVVTYVLDFKTKRVNQNKFISVYIVSKLFFNNFIENLYSDNTLFLQLSQALPMIYPPSNWNNFNMGGYFLKPSLVMRASENEQLGVIQRADMQRVYNSKADQSSTAFLGCLGASTSSCSRSSRSSTTREAAKRRSL